MTNEHDLFPIYNYTNYKLLILQRNLPFFHEPYAFLVFENNLIVMRPVYINKPRKHVISLRKIF